MVIAEFRRMTGLTQTELGNLTSIPQKRIGYLERGERPIWFGELMSIMRAFDRAYHDGVHELYRRLPLDLKEFIADELAWFNDG